MEAALRARSVAAVVAAACVACGGDGSPVGPEPPAGALRYTQITAGYYHTCALSVERRAYCWGGNGSGALGDGTREDRARPAAVTGVPAFTAVDAGAGHTCALTSGGAAWCWGQNDEGQLGDGTFVVRERPTAVSGGHTFTQVSAGHAHSCGVTAEGAAWCWGDDVRGQLGDGAQTTTKSASPVRVALVQPLARIDAGYYQTCALGRSGEAWCWGRGTEGQNGDGTMEDRSVPVRVPGGRAFQAIAAGDRFVCAVSSGQTWCWGANRHAELGTTAGGATPARLELVPSLVGIVASIGASTIPTVEAYACGIESGGRGFCWGGTVRSLRARSAAPVALGGTMRFAALAAGAQHTCGLDLRGYAWCGGANYAGQLGNGSRQDPGGLVAVAGPES